MAAAMNERDSMKPMKRALMVAVAIVASTIVGVGGGGSASADPVPAPTCPNPPMAQSFLNLGDANYYFRMIGGGFEGANPGWTLSNGASIRTGGSWLSPLSPMPASASDNKTLVLRPGAIAKSAPFCVSGTAPVMRFFSRSQFVGSSVWAIVSATNDTGATASVLWTPTVQFLPFWSSQQALFRLPFLADHLTTVTITLVSAGLTTAEVDDVFIDPLRQR